MICMRHSRLFEKRYIVEKLTDDLQKYDLII